MFWSLTGAAFTVVVAYALGVGATRNRAGFAASLATGAALTSLLVFVFLTLHMRGTFPLSFGAVFLLPLLWRYPAKMTLAGFPRWLWLVLIPFGIYAVIHALSPETQADPNVYHLQPAIDSQLHHSFSPIIGFYNRLPHAFELLYIQAFDIGGAPAARLLHLFFLVATLPVIAALGRQFGLSNTVSWIAASIYGISPVVLATAASAYNDAALTFATATSILVLVTGGPVWIAGLIAGFCFSIKMTGGIVAAIGLAWFAWHRRWRDAAIFLGAASIPAAPWLIRNLIQIHNPLAPFGNRWFPNPLFHISTEHDLMQMLRNYGIRFWQRFPELIWGWRLQGMIGPAFALAPLGLLARRSRQTMPLVLFTLALSIPWWLNAGARFLMPAIPFLALAILSVTPLRLAPAILVVQTIACWPLVLDRIQPNTSHLFGFPWRVAVGLESRTDFLDRTNWDYRYAKLVEQHTDDKDRILDVYGLHRAHITREVVGWWQSAWSENAFRTLEFARQPGEEKLFDTRAVFPPQMVRGVRIRPAQASPGAWSLVEIEPLSGAEPVMPSSKWALSAKPNRWETPLAFDRNLATRWHSWQSTEPRQFLAVDFVEPIHIDSVRFISTHWDSGNTRFNIDLQQPNGTWTAAPLTRVDALGPLNLMPSALRYVKKAGFTYIIGRAGDEGTSLLIQSLVHDPGIAVAGQLNEFYVLKIR